MTWDESHNAVVMVGGLPTGLLPGGVLNDTWMWDGTDWTQLVPAASPSAYLSPFVFNASSGTSVLFIGFESSSDTWTWNGATWTDVLPGASYPWLYESNMVYDVLHNQVVLFGGMAQNAQGSSILSNQTWILTAQ